jgi:hypothetical protein
LQPGQSYTRTFDGSVTTIPYHCAIHGAASMSGALNVQAAGTAGGASPSPSATASPGATPSASPSQSAGQAGGTVPISGGGTGY